MAKALPYIAALPSGRLGLSIINGKALGYVDGDAVEISPHVARALASRWLAPKQKNQLIAAGFLPACATVRKRLAKLPIEVINDTITVGKAPDGGSITMDGFEVFNSSLGTLNTYWTPWGQMHLVSGVARKAVKAVKAVRDEFRGDLREAVDYSIDLLKGGAFGATFGTIMGVTLAGVILWTIYGGGAATLGASAVAAGRKYIK